MIKSGLVYLTGVTKGEPRLWYSSVPSSKRNEGILLAERSFRGGQSFLFFIQNFALSLLFSESYDDSIDRGIVSGVGIMKLAGTTISGGPGEMERAE